jgi:hypothetical protein
MLVRPRVNKGRLVRAEAQPLNHAARLMYRLVNIAFVGYNVSRAPKPSHLCIAANSRDIELDI